MLLGNVFLVLKRVHAIRKCISSFKKCSRVLIKFMFLSKDIFFNTYNFNNMCGKILSSIVCPRIIDPQMNSF